MKAWLNKIDPREALRDGVSVAGAAALYAGLAMNFGHGWALTALGVLLLLLVLLPRRAA